MILRDDNRSIEQTWNMKKWYSFYTSYEDFGDAVNALSGQMDISSLKLQQVAAEIQETASEEKLQQVFGTGRADHCIVADNNGKVIGAVWTRIMNDYGHVDDETPSFAISLYKEYRGQGIGTRMMNEMLALLKEKGYKQASLAVQKANYAVRMYEKVGFKTVDENAEEYIMVCEL